jgi:hypothetical protein
MTEQKNPNLADTQPATMVRRADSFGAFRPHPRMTAELVTFCRRVGLDEIAERLESQQVKLTELSAELVTLRAQKP